MILRKTLLATALGAALLAMLPARATQIVTDAVMSQALGRNYPYTVYLPSGYLENPQRRYPVLYLLHGANGDENEWLAKGNVRAVFDNLIAAAKIPPMVVVMPGHTAGWWVDGSKERGETALLNDLLPAVESKYRVRTDRGGRLFAGNSSGAYAVTRFALKHPELFVAGAALSPAVYRDEPPATSSARKQAQFFDSTGHYSKKVWSDLNYLPLIEGYQRQPLRVPLYINSGDHDRFAIAEEATQLFATFQRLQPGKTELRIVDGDHEWSVWSSTIGDAVVYLSGYLQPTAQLLQASQQIPEPANATQR